MLGLVVAYCIASTGQCDATLVARGFSTERQCQELSVLLVKGWESLHPKAEVQRYLCTDSIAYVLSAWKA